MDPPELPILDTEATNKQRECNGSKMDDRILFAKILGITPPWFIKKVMVNEKEQRIDIFVDHEPGIRVRCPSCNEFYGMYDHAPERVYRHLDTCQMQTYIHVRPPRVNCPKHGVVHIDPQFGENGSEMTFAFESQVIRVALECSMEATARLCKISWDRSWGALTRAVDRGLKRKPHQMPTRIGVDEKSIARGHKYETLVYNLHTGTVEYVGDDRGRESLERYYRQFTRDELEKVEAVAMDMWDPYIAATKAHVPDAGKKIVFDRFHVMKQVLEAVDKVRKSEHRQLTELGAETLKGTRYLWLWSKENIPDWRKEEFEALRAKNLRTGRAWSIKENIRHLWTIVKEEDMRAYFKRWYFWATHSRLEPIKKSARTLKSHIDNIVTYAQHGITNALAEGINTKIEKIKRMACGFRNRAHYRTAIYFHCGGLDLFPKPPVLPALIFKMG
jgi:transposase